LAKTPVISWRNYATLLSLATFGWHNTIRNVPIFVASPKVTKESRVAYLRHKIRNVFAKKLYQCKLFFLESGGML
jgi:hypothetical protein